MFEFGRTRKNLGEFGRTLKKLGEFSTTLKKLGEFSTTLKQLLNPLTLYHIPPSCCLLEVYATFPRLRHPLGPPWEEVGGEGRSFRQKEEVVWAVGELPLLEKEKKLNKTMKLRNGRVERR